MTLMMQKYFVENAEEKEEKASKHENTKGER